MIKKFFAYILIFFLVLPPTLFLKPKNADAIVPFVARQVVSYAVSAGLGTFLSNKFSVPLKPQKGKLYNLVSNRWVGSAAASIAANAAIWSYLLYQDNTATKCQDVTISLGIYNGRGTSWSSALDNFILDYHTKYPAGLSTFSLGTKHTYLNPSTNSTLISSYDLVETSPTSTYVQVSAATCLSYGTVTTSAFDTAKDDQLKDVLWLENNSPKFVEAVQKELLKNPDTPLDGSQGLSLEEVQSQSYTDSKGVIHNITKDPTTGKLLDNGVPLPDEMIIIDINGVVHRYTVDPVTGNILDNTNPVGNFAQWTDSLGVVHTVTVDPLTGKLKDNNETWNPDTLTPTASNPSGGTVTVDPYTGQTVVDLPPVDFQPLLDAQATAINEQKKTTDAVNKNNDSLQDIYSALSDSQQKDQTDRNSLNSQLSSIRSIESSKSYMGISGFMTRVQNSPFYISMSNALLVNGATGYPSWGINQSINLVGQTFTIDASLNTQDYAWMLDSMRVVILLGSGWFAFRRIFG